MTENDSKPPLERAVELLVYAPLGAALFARDVLPPLVEQFVARGRTQIEQQVAQAKIIGQFAVNQGSQELEKRLERVRMVPFDRLSRTPAAPSASPAEEPAASGNGSSAPATPQADSSHLAIPDYDELSASQVVARLDGLSTEELASVREYEESGRQRKTILTKIEQLT